jgi:hypothetical protein
MLTVARLRLVALGGSLLVLATGCGSSSSTDSSPEAEGGPNVILDGAPDREGGASADATEGVDADATALAEGGDGSLGGDGGMDGTVDVTVDAAVSDDPARDEPDATTSDATTSDEPGAAEDATSSVETDATLDAEAGPPSDAEAGPPSGALTWAERFGVTVITSATNVAMDPTNGDIVMVGIFNGSTDFGDGVMTQSDSGLNDFAVAGIGGFFARFDSAGRAKQSRAFVSYPPADASTGGLMMPGSVSVDASGRVLVSGEFRGTVDFGAGPISSSGLSENDYFLAKLDSAGALVWVKTFSQLPIGSGAGQILPTTTSDPAGNTYLAVTSAGAGNPTPDFGCGALPEGVEFVAKFDATGACVWSGSYGASHDSGIAGYMDYQRLAVDPAGNLFVAGSFDGTVDLGSGDVNSSNALSTFVQKFSPTGTLVWGKALPVQGGIPLSGIAADGYGNLVLTGGFVLSADFGCGVMSAPYTLPNIYANVFIAKLDGAGNCLWSKGFGDSNSQAGSAVAVSPTGDIAITGSFYGTLDFGGGPLAGSLFVADFDPAGVYRWSQGIAGQVALGTNTYTVYEGWIGASGTNVVIAGGFDSPTLSVAGQVLPLGSLNDAYLVSFVP